MPTVQWISFSLAALCLLLSLALLLLLRRDAAASREAARRQEALLNQIADELLAHQEAQTALLRDALQAGEERERAATEGLRQQLLMQSQGQEERLNQLQAAVRETLTQMDSRVEQLRQGVNGQLTELRRDQDSQLREMRRTVEDKLTESIDKRLSASWAQVNQRLEQVTRGLGEMQTLAAGVGDLKKVLTNVKTRGTWGEVQLGVLLEQILAPGQWEANVTVVPGSGEVVEFAIRLPGSGSAPVWLPIDSKFPQEDYVRLQDAQERGDKAAVDEARKALRARIRLEARRIAGKYVAPPHSTDFAVMFLPVEGLYAEVLRDTDTVESVQREQRVVIAGPSTLAALLNALQMGFRTLAIQQRSGEVWQLLAAVKNDFGRFGEILEKTRIRLQQASESIDTAFTRTRSIQRRLEAVEQDALPEGSAVEDAEE